MNEENELMETDIDFDDNVLEDGNYSQQSTQVDGDGEEIKPWVGDSNTDNQSSQQQETSSPNYSDNDDAITAYLKSKGISNPQKIKFEDDNGQMQERSWNTLSREEQLNILNTQNTDPDTDLDDEEIALINQMRLNGMTPEEFVNTIHYQGVQTAMQSQQQNQQQEEPSYTVDELTDDELFVLDLMSRVPDLTDEEANEALSKAKEDDNLFQKQILGVRDEYKRIEEETNNRAQLEEQQRNQEQFQQFQDSVADAIENFRNIGGLDIDLEQDDQEELANFLLSTDQAGVSYLGKALDDPDTLVRMAWFALKGEDTIDGLTQYFTNEIKKVSRSSYEKGLQDAKNGTSNKPNVVIQQKNNNGISGFGKKQEYSVNDIDY